MASGRDTHGFGWAVVITLGLAVASASADDDITRALATIKAVGREGAANDAAGGAWKELVGRGGAALLPTLAAIDDAQPTAANWLRTAVDAIAEAETSAGRPLPADKLEAFVKDTKFAPSARRLAYELLARSDQAVAARLLPGFLNDPSADLRREAVAAELARLEKAGSPKAELQKLFTFARDKDQVDALAKTLAAQGTPVSVGEHFAFVTAWRVVGPFESASGKALTVSYPPQTAADAKAPFKGKAGDVTWTPFTTADKYGMVDLNKALGKSMNACGYARAVLVAEKDTPCEVRVGSPNAVQVFLNGKKLYEREEYHHGSALDYHVGKGVLKAGENVLLVKACQNDQKDSWAQAWQFQARVCDATGGPLPGVTQVLGDGPAARRVKLGSAPAPTPEEKK